VVSYRYVVQGRCFVPALTLRFSSHSFPSKLLLIFANSVVFLLGLIVPLIGVRVFTEATEVGVKGAWWGTAVGVEAGVEYIVNAKEL